MTCFEILYFYTSANDYPHGIFTLKKENQRILVTPHMTRLLLVNVTRDQGLFDKVAVGFSVEYENVSCKTVILNKLD